MFRTLRGTGVGTCYRAGRYLVTRRHTQNSSPPSIAYLARVYQPLLLFVMLRSFGKFTYVCHTSSLALTRLWLPGGRSSRDLRPAFRLCFIVEIALYSDLQSHSVTRVVPSISFAGNSEVYDFMSHRVTLHIRRKITQTFFKFYLTNILLKSSCLNVGQT